MSVLMRDLLIRGSANMNDIDGVAEGGAVNFANKVSFVDITPQGTISFVSSSSGDGSGTSVNVYGRDPTGTIQLQTMLCSGTTPVTGAQVYERFMKVLASGTTAIGDLAVYATTQIISGTAVAAAQASGVTDASVTLASGQGASCAIGDIFRPLNNSPAGVNFQLREIIALSGDVAYVNADWGTVPTSGTTYAIYQGFLLNVTYSTAQSMTGYQVTQVRRPFYNVASDAPGGSTRNFYEKLFAININTATALTSGSIIKQVDPSLGTINFALTSGATAGATAGLNDVATVANRQTAPVANITAFSAGAAPQTINIPNTNQNLPSGAPPNAAGAQAIWCQLQLLAGLAPTKTNFTLRISGQTT